MAREWSVYPRRPHWTAIAHRVDVLAVEPPAGLLTFLRHPKRLWRYLRDGRKPRMSASGALLWRPLSLVSTGLAYRVSWLAQLDRWWIRRQLKPIVRAATKPDQPTVTFLVQGQQAYLRDAVDTDLLCFEITDEYRVLGSHRQLDTSEPRTILMTEREKHILEKAGLVIVSSEPLLRSRSREHANTHYLPNCAEYHLFSQKVPDWEKIAVDLAGLPSPRLGYIGGLNDWMDLDLLIKLAEAYPDASLVLIGGESSPRQFQQDTRYQRLKSMTNVHFLGFKKYETLPAYLHGLDVCLLPFILNEWIRNCSPNKIYQYLAAGKPVVSTDYPEARHAEPDIMVAADHTEFVSLVDRALGSHDDETIRARQKRAQANTTETRADALLELVRQSLLSDGESVTDA